MSFDFIDMPVNFLYNFKNGNGKSLSPQILKHKRLIFNVEFQATFADSPGVDNIISLSRNTWHTIKL